MKAISTKVMLLNATHEVKCRLQQETFDNWTLLKADLQSKTGKVYSDSAFFNWCINELATLTLLVVR
jgi:hypothetical protein